MFSITLYPLVLFLATWADPFELLSVPLLLQCFLTLSCNKAETDLSRPTSLFPTMHNRCVAALSCRVTSTLLLLHPAPRPSTRKTTRPSPTFTFVAWPAPSLTNSFTICANLTATSSRQKPSSTSAQTNAKDSDLPCTRRRKKRKLV